VLAALRQQLTAQQLIHAAQAESSAAKNIRSLNRGLVLMLVALEPDAVAHRVVHGQSVQQATDRRGRVATSHQELVSIDPNHLPPALAGLDATRRTFPWVTPYTIRSRHHRATKSRPPRGAGKPRCAIATSTARTTPLRWSSIMPLAQSPISSGGLIFPTLHPSPSCAAPTRHET
jgi:hypothetical protein